MEIKWSHNNRFFTVETSNYKCVFDTERGGTMKEMKIKPENQNVVFREGIEMYWARQKVEETRDPHVKPQTSSEGEHWDKRHFEQEYGGIAPMHCKMIGDYLILTVESSCCWTLHPPQFYGKTKTNWYFHHKIPYVYIEFEEDNMGMNPKGSEQWFKRYMASSPNVFTHYAKKLDDWALNNLNIIPDNERYTKGDIYVRTPLEIQIEGHPPRYPCAKWLTLFNNNFGFAMIPLNQELWFGDNYPETSRCGLFHSWSMDELIYYCRHKDKTVHQLDMIYYPYHTTPEKQYRILDEIKYDDFEKIKNENSLVRPKSTT